MPHKRAKRSVRDRKRLETSDDLAPGARKNIENEEVPKSVARVLNAAKVHREWAERKRQGVDDGGARKRRRTSKDEGEGEGARTSLRIMPGESMAHFNRRVEDSMRHSVREAMHTSSARARQVRKEEEEAERAAKRPLPSGTRRAKAPVGGGSDVKGEQEEKDCDHQQRTRTRTQTETGSVGDSKPREFETVSSSAPKRLNDVVQAPPTIKKLPRKAKKLAALGAGQKADGARTLSEGVRTMAQKAMLEEERERAIRLYREMKKGKGLPGS